MLPSPDGGEPARFFTPGTMIALIGIALCVLLVAWQPQTGAEAVPEPESTALLELQSKLIVGVASMQRDRAIEEARQLESLAGTPAGARALAALYLYLKDDTLRARARQLLESSPGDTESHRILLGATLASTSLDEAERETLMDEMGWFGILAAAADDPVARGRVAEAGTRLMLVAGLAAVAGGGAFFVGILLLVAAAFNREQLRSRLGPGEIPAVLLLQAFGLYLLTMIGGSFLSARFGIASLAASSLVIFLALLVGLAYPVIRGVPWTLLRQELGLTLGKGILRECAAGLAAYCAGLPVIALGIVITVVLQKVAGGWMDGDGGGAPQAISHPILGLLKGAGWQGLLLVGFLASVQGPIVEEIMFRGAFYRGLRSRFGPAVSLLAMAFCFAAVHPQGLLAVPALMGMAIAFGWMREWRGSLIAGIVTHGLHNGVLIAIMAVALAS